jgi:hypothetical protein
MGKKIPLPISWKGNCNIFLLLGVIHVVAIVLKGNDSFEERNH